MARAAAAIVPAVLIAVTACVEVGGPLAVDLRIAAGEERKQSGSSSSSPETRSEPQQQQDLSQALHERAHASRELLEQK